MGIKIFHPTMIRNYERRSKPPFSSPSLDADEERPGQDTKKRGTVYDEEQESLMKCGKLH